MESTEINPHIYNQLTFNKDVKINGERTVLTKGVESNGYPHEKE